MTTRTNSIDTEDLRALCGPVPTGNRLAAVVKDGESWRYQFSTVDPRQAPEASEAFSTPEAARKALAQHFTGEERQAWDSSPFTTLPPGQGWYRQRVGDREISTEAVFVRACHVGNVDLARSASEKITHPNARDEGGNSLLIHAARMVESREPMERLLAKGANPKRSNEQGWTPAHAAAALGDDDRLKALQKAGARVDVADQSGQTPSSLAPNLSLKNTVLGPRSNPNAPGSQTLPPRPAAPSQSKTRGRDVRSF